MRSFNLSFDKLANQILNENSHESEAPKNLSPEQQELVDTLLDEHGDGEVGLQDALQIFLSTDEETPEKLAELKSLLKSYLGKEVDINLDNESVYIVDGPPEESEEEEEEEGAESEEGDSITVVSEEEPEEGGMEVVLDVRGDKITVQLHPSGEVDYFDAEGNVWGAEGEEYFSDVQDFILTKYPMEEDEE